MIRPGVSSMFFHEHPIDEIFSSVEEAGLSGIEFWVETPHFWLRGLPLADIDAAVREHPALSPISVHAPVLDLNPCSINPRVAMASVQYAVEAVDLAEAVGAAVLTVHPGRRTARRSPSAYDYERFEGYLSRLGEAAGGKGVRVAIENMEPRVNSLLCSPGAVREVLDEHSWLWFTLDVAHAMNASPQGVIRYIETCGDRCANVHLSAAMDGRMHLPVDGDRRIATIIRSLADAGYDGPLTLEIDDQAFSRPLSLEEKIGILRRQRVFIEDCLR
ncbi:sugar phosphate isomerase/epimerase family protein [Methanofollis fontis]|uniref:Sugar phosphate isomerase/epimerase n=1 Tax=Methanofollis fontis TaxID=2052832 RepID=A0A483CV27_9EURY|nr:sugar phosphate isomerase/epimerase [Methanofollis fontis]TAJ44827.1 sugar phosphate isomerase/epimerase [Methanofollis fontis]